MVKLWITVFLLGNFREYKGKGKHTMNYIKRLEKENEELRTILTSAKQILTDCCVYLDSKKFRCGDPLDGYVNISDVQDQLFNARTCLSVPSDHEQGKVAQHGQ